MKLGIGILNLELEWILLLEQIGVPYSILNYANFSEDAKDFPVLILKDLGEISTFNLNQYVSSGGVIITDAKTAEKNFNLPKKNNYVKYLATNEKLFQENIFCDIYRKFTFTKKSNLIINETGKELFYFNNIGEGILAVIPQEFIKSITDIKAMRKKFPSAFGKKYVSEKVAKVSKGKIRIIIHKLFEYIFQLKRLPFLTKWNFPENNKNIFCFRVDTDYSSIEQIYNLYKTCEKHQIKASWFIETKSIENELQIFNQFNNQEFGYHCFRHKISSSYQKNLDDINHGLELLKNIGINPKGYAAPYGEWNENLNKALEHFNFFYSSEFCFDYDNLPSFPIVGKDFSKVLQIPIHPISVGRLSRTQHTKDEMLQYFLDIINEKLYFDEPIIFYTHPFQNRFELFDELFIELKKLKIRNYSFIEYAKWWKERLALEWDVDYQNNKIIINTSNCNENFLCKVRLPNGDVFIEPITNGEIGYKNKLENEIIYDKKLNYSELRKFDINLLKEEIIFRLRRLKQ
ncbi:MAG: polysaccharide deacetylase family protein [Ignavibacteriales bacterium]|nr:polysaccharide deacetylase family protein [Ignavibacteriales bacterium]